MKRCGYKFLILSLICAGFFCIQYNIVRTSFALATEKININTATAVELDSLPGIGPVKAQVIVDYRNINGLFLNIEAIKNVSGVGDATFNNFKDLITVGETVVNSVCGDGKLDSGEECDDGNENSGDGCDYLCKIETAPIAPPQTDAGQSETSVPQEIEIAKHYNLGDVVINEFVSDPADDEVEWIELYNTQNTDMNLDGWTIEEGSGAKTVLFGIISKSGDNKFKVVEKPKGNLNNSGDAIILRDNENNLIDRIAYGDWNDGDLKNNATTAKDPDSAARKINGYNTYNNAADFAVTKTPTKGKSNIILKMELEIKNQELESGQYDFNDKIFITEIFPNPQGDDGRNEFIELYNGSDKDANLTGWRLGDKSSQREFGKKIKTTVLKAKKYLAVYRSESSLALNNSGDEVKLYRPFAEAPAQTVKYEKAAEDLSYAINFKQTLDFSKIQWLWTETATPGKENIIKTVNHPPAVDFNFPEEIIAGRPTKFDGSDTYDEDGGALAYEWSFGDKIKSNLVSPEHIFAKAGNFTVKLSAGDGRSTTTKEKIIKVGKNEPLSADVKSASALVKSSGQNNNSNKIIINEFLPNPEGDDATGEWIELKNTGSGKINLLNWKIDDGEEGSSPYEFANALINGNNFFVLSRIKSGLALNNTGDSIRLFNDLDELIDEVEYGAAKEGSAYARDSKGAWHWTTVLTPQEENEIVILNENKGAKSKASASKKKTAQIVETVLEKIREFEPGDEVKVKGTVVVKPGIIGSQIFYIAGSPGVQIYNYKKDFPALNVGDYVEVSGEISISAGEQRIKTGGKDDIKVIEHRPEPKAIKLACDQVSEEYLGQLVEISGEVTERKSSTVILDDGADEAVVYIKKASGINVASIKAGDKISVVGVVGKTTSGVRIMPRSNDDIVRKDAESAGQALGETAVNDEWEIAQRDKKLELFEYLSIIGGGVLVVLAGMLVRMKMKK